MSNLSRETEKQIEDNAKKYAEVKYEEIWHKKGLHRKTLLLYAHMTGATEWAGKAQGLVDTLNKLNTAIDKIWNECNTRSIPDKYKKEIAAAQAQCGDAIAKYKEVSNG